jgi:hypothetical protein
MARYHRVGLVEREGLSTELQHSGYRLGLCSADLKRLSTVEYTYGH